MIFDKSDIIAQGIAKKDGKLDKSWKEIGEPYGLQGNDVRILTQNYQRRNGLLKGKYEAGREKILIFSDLHIPDHKEEMILDFVKEHAKVDLIILNGDILDCHAVSAWHNEDVSVLDHEMIMAHDLLTKIRAITKARIMMVKGNHEQRVNTHYAKYSKSMGTAVVETEILYKLAHGFTIKGKKSGKRKDYPAIPGVEYCEARSWMYGDLLVNHPSAFRKNPMCTVQLMWEEKLKGKYPTAKVILIGHTHQLGLVHYQDGRILIEGGCTCFPASYADADDRPFKIQQYGYVYLEMKNKEVDINSIRIQYLGCDVLPDRDYSNDIQEF